MKRIGVILRINGKWPWEDSSAPRYFRYASYIQSPFWRRKKAEYQAEFGIHCEVCGPDMGVDIHHISYQTLFSESHEHLMCLCRKCHKRSHSLAKEADKSDILKSLPKDSRRKRFLSDPEKHISGRLKSSSKRVHISELTGYFIPAGSLFRNSKIDFLDQDVGRRISTVEAAADSAARSVAIENPYDDDSLHL